MKRSELNKILKNKKITHCYIRKNGSYYRPNCCGYTDFRHKAGVYEKEDAVNQSLSCSELIVIPINVSEHNEMLLQAIKDISENIIKTKDLI